MREKIIILILLSVIPMLGAMKRPLPAAPLPMAREVLFEPQAQRSCIDPAGYELSRSKIELSNYLDTHLHCRAYVRPVITMLWRPKRMVIPNETYFEDSYWVANPGRDLRALAKDVIALLNRPEYASIIKDPQFIEYVSAYLSDRYHPIITDQLRAMIPFGALPAVPVWITQAFDHKKEFEKMWCKELLILAKWLDAGVQANDPFYENGILLLLNSIPEKHPLITQPAYCLKSLLNQVSGKKEHSRILNALHTKGIK